MLIAGVFSFIGDSIQEIIVGLFLLVDSLVYSVISWLYQIFCVLASFRLFDSDMYESITKSIYIVIGVVALFLLAYQLLQTMARIEDNKVFGDTRKIVTNLVTSLIMIALVPSIFDFMYSFQNSILGSNVIGRIILPAYSFDSINSAVLEYEDEDGNTTSVSLGEISEYVTEESYNYYLLQYYGNNTATQLFQAFFYPTSATVNNFDELAYEIKTDENENWLGDLVVNVTAYGSCGLAVASSFGVTVLTSFIGSPSIAASLAYCASAIGVAYVGTELLDVSEDDYTLADAYNYASVTGDFSVFQKFSSNIINEEITYHYILSTAVGVVAAYILLLYCIDLGVRAVKLAFYQILAPIPIITRVIPKQDKIFNNWLKATLSTYAEVFVRMVILYFGVFIISNIPSIMGNVISNDSTPYSTNALIYLLVRAIIIIGILIFVRQMPKILEDITGIKSGNFSLNIKDHLKEAAWAPAAIGGLVTSGGSPMGMIRAGAAGWRNNNLKGIGQEYKRRQARLSAREEGARWHHRAADRARMALGLPGLKDSYEDALKSYYNPNTREYFNAQNQSNDAIVDLNGNTIIQAGGSIDLNPENVRILSEQVALNNERKAEISEQVRQFKGANDSNQQYKSDEDAMKGTASKKVGQDNKYWVRADGNGALLDLRFTDVNGNVRSSLQDGMHTAAELSDWLDTAKNNGIISEADAGKLRGQLNTAINKHSVDSYISTNGEDWQSAASEMLKLVQANRGSLTPTDYVQLQADYVTSAINSNAGARQFIDDARQKLIAAGVDQQDIDNAAATSVESTIINNKAALLDQLKNDGINMIDANGQIVNYREGRDQNGNIIMVDSNGNSLSQVIQNMGLNIDIDRIMNTAAADLSKSDISDLTDFIKDHVDGNFQAIQMTLTRDQSIVDNQNTLINNMIDQGKNQAESFRKSEQYQQADAASRANQTTDQGNH